MRRLQLFQFKDQTWLPAFLRDGLAAFHAVQHRLVKSPRAFAAIVDQVCTDAGTTHIVDLDSGGGGPFLSLMRQLRAQAPRSWHAVLTDHHPDARAADRIARRGDDGVRYELAPIDVTRVPDHLPGVRTFVAAFHSLHPLAARAALRDAFDKRQALCVLEVTRNSPLALATTLAMPALYWLAAPFFRPRSWVALFFTYPVPLLPLLAAWDAWVANRRTYSRAEYQAMTVDLKASDYRWSVRSVRVAGVPYELDCLVGTPVAAARVNAA